MQQTVYKLSIGNILSCARTMSFCQRCMAYLVQVVCGHKFNASVMQDIINHAIGCYLCLFCIIASDEKYSQELKNLSLLQAELEKAQQSHEELQNMATYMALVNGEKSPLAVKLLTQSVAKTKSVKALVSHNEYTIMN